MTYNMATPPKTNMDTGIPKIAMFQLRYIFQTVIFGIYVSFRGCINWSCDWKIMEDHWKNLSDHESW